MKIEIEFTEEEMKAIELWIFPQVRQLIDKTSPHWPDFKQHLRFNDWILFKIWLQYNDKENEYTEDNSPD